MNYSNPYYQQPNYTGMPQLNPYMPYYQPYAQQQVNNQPQTNQQVPQIKLDTVSGKTAADVYNVNVGEDVILFDIDNPVVYKKHRGFDNKLETEEFDLVRRVDEKKEDFHQINLDEYLKADAVEELVAEHVKEEVDRRLSEISFTPKTSRKTTKGDD